jgi:hypothetical protein
MANRVRVTSVGDQLLININNKEANFYNKENSKWGASEGKIVYYNNEANVSLYSEIFSYLPSEFVTPKEGSIQDLLLLLNEVTKSVGLLTNTIVVKSLDDFPDAVNGVIFLTKPNVVYRIDGEVNVSDIVFIISATGIYFSGQEPSKDKIISTTTATLITTTNFGFRAENITIKADTATEVFHIADNATERFILDHCTIDTTGALGTLNTLGEVFINLCDFINFTSGFDVLGLIDILRVETNIVYNFTGIFLDLTGSTSRAINVRDNVITLDTGATFLQVEPLGANLITGSEGDILSNNVDNTAGGTVIVGYTGFESQWAVLGNSHINDSDRFEPTGWANYQDGETTPATQTITITPSKLLIDGLGAATEEAYLPLSIRGTSSLWDTANDRITPVLLGDSYDARVVLEVTGKSGTPTLMTLELDIGGGVSPTISVVTDDRATSKTPPFSLVFTFPIFSLATFIANGGQFFLSVNTGTYTIAERSVYIARTSSGSV